MLWLLVFQPVVLVQIRVHQGSSRSSITNTQKCSTLRYIYEDDGGTSGIFMAPVVKRVVE